jgi:hypothetical protein
LEYNPIKELNSRQKIKLNKINLILVILTQNKMNLKDIVDSILFNEYDRNLKEDLRSH